MKVVEIQQRKISVVVETNQYDIFFVLFRILEFQLYADLSI